MQTKPNMNWEKNHARKLGSTTSQVPQNYFEKPVISYRDLIWKFIRMCHSVADYPRVLRLRSEFQKQFVMHFLLKFLTSKSHSLGNESKMNLLVLVSV